MRNGDLNKFVLSTVMGMKMTVNLVWVTEVAVEAISIAKEGFDVVMSTELQQS